LIGDFRFLVRVLRLPLRRGLDVSFARRSA